MRTIGWMTLAMAGMLVACGDNETSAPYPDPETPVATVFEATGDISAKVDEFRNALGPSNGGTAGEQPAGRREISWDGAAANPFNNKNDFPADFFNTNVKSGAVFTTAGTGFRNDSLLFSRCRSCSVHSSERNWTGTVASLVVRVGGPESR